VLDRLCQAFGLQAKPVQEQVLLDSEADISDADY
jgi:hypothetical protein